jgi:hypothetical protein
MQSSELDSVLLVACTTQHVTVENSYQSIVNKENQNFQPITGEFLAPTCTMLQVTAPLTSSSSLPIFGVHREFTLGLILLKFAIGYIGIVRPLPYWSLLKTHDSSFVGSLIVFAGGVNLARLTIVGFSATVRDKY